jgi:hypothetical protein
MPMHAAAAHHLGEAGGGTLLPGRAEWQRPVVKDRSDVLAWLGGVITMLRTPKCAATTISVEGAFSG